jgi:hypothetical protein
MFALFPYAVNACLSPAVATVNVPDWLAEKLSGLPLGKTKSLLTNMTVRELLTALLLVTASLVSSG